MNALKPFTTDDYELFPGVTDFANGAKPLIAETKVDDEFTGFVVVDASGVFFIIVEEWTGEINRGTLNDPGLAALFVGGGILDNYDTGSLIDAGFQFVPVQ
jgi:hypothetical protein